MAKLSSKQVAAINAKKKRQQPQPKKPTMLALGRPRPQAPRPGYPTSTIGTRG